MSHWSNDLKFRTPKLLDIMETLFSLLTPLTIIAIAGCGLMAGLFFVFSFSVMDALSQMPPSDGMKAMQLINRTILNPVFLGSFVGTAVACLLVAIISLIHRESGYGWALLGAIIYLVGGFGVTAARNVPLNNSLDAQTPGSAEANELWSHYVKHWTRWNHLRTIACISATVLLTIGLC